MDSPIPNSLIGGHVCVGCGSEITDQFLLRVAPDLEWHSECLRCADCFQVLDENCTCFVRDGKTYCKHDYHRLFGAKCAKCGRRFARNDLVMRAKTKIFHLDCFTCFTCGRLLVPGDEFALRADDKLLCRIDHEETNDQTTNDYDDYINTTTTTEQQQHEDIIRTESNNNNNNDSKLMSTDSSSSHGSSSPVLSRSICGSGSVGQFQHHGRASSGRGGHHHHHHHHHQKGDQKTTRIRTVLNEKQLHTLRTCYSANSRPDALMKEQLVEMTGLSARVIRVWFQNKRCKDKKRSIVLKQLQQQSKNDRCIMDESNWLLQKGIPLIATSPVRHEPPTGLQASPVEVERYLAPWSSDVNEQQTTIQVERQPTSLRHQHHHHLVSNPFADSFDDDTVVSFDDLSEGPQGPGSGGPGRMGTQPSMSTTTPQQTPPVGLHSGTTGYVLINGRKS